MPEEYFDVAYINDKVVLHGRATAGHDNWGVRIEREVEQELTEEQKQALSNLTLRHQIEIDELLSSFVDREALATADDQ